MPTNPPPSEHNPRSGPNAAAIVVVIALVLGCLWLVSALSNANSKLNCIASGRRNCDQIDQ